MIIINNERDVEEVRKRLIDKYPTAGKLRAENPLVNVRLTGEFGAVEGKKEFNDYVQDGGIFVSRGLVNPSGTYSTVGNLPGGWYLFKMSEKTDEIFTCLDGTLAMKITPHNGKIIPPEILRPSESARALVGETVEIHSIPLIQGGDSFYHCSYHQRG